MPTSARSGHAASAEAGAGPLLSLFLCDAFVYEDAQGFRDSVMYLANADVAMMYSCVRFSDYSEKEK